MRRLSHRHTLLAGAAGVALAASPPQARSQDTLEADRRLFRLNALGHAYAVQDAYEHLKRHIRRESTDLTTWSGEIPARETGWRAEWTLRGLRARYCEDYLLVYLRPGDLQGVGGDHNAVRISPQHYRPETGSRRHAQLHWVNGDKLHGGGRGVAIALPACITEMARGGRLPAGRAALGGIVADPFAPGNLGERRSWENRRLDCPRGFHGGGKHQTRETVQPLDGRGEDYGAPSTQDWKTVVDLCIADAEGWKSIPADPRNPKAPTIAEPVIQRTKRDEYSKRDYCSWYQLGTHTYHREVITTKTAYPWDRQPVVRVRYGDWAYRSDDCWTPAPKVETGSTTESRTVDCPAGQRGSRMERREITTTETRYYLGHLPSENHKDVGEWYLHSDGCEAVPVVVAKAPKTTTTPSRRRDARPPKVETKTTTESRAVACPAGQRGSRTERREVTKTTTKYYPLPFTHDIRYDFGEWYLHGDGCEAIPEVVAKAPKTTTTPSRPRDTPAPRTRKDITLGKRTLACPTGQQGSRTEHREVTRTTTYYPLTRKFTHQYDHGEWYLHSDGCEAVPVVVAKAPKAATTTSRRRDAPAPRTSKATTLGKRTLACPTGQQGSRTEHREITRTTTYYPLTRKFTHQYDHGEWYLHSDGCEAIPEVVAVAPKTTPTSSTPSCTWTYQGGGEGDGRWVCVNSGGGEDGEIERWGRRGSGGGDGGGHGDSDGPEDGSDDTGGPGEGSDDGPGGADNADGEGS